VAIIPGIILALILLLQLPVFAGSLEGRTAYRKGDYATALREFGSDEQAGPVSTYYLALMNLRGEGVPRDETRGLKLLRTSADKGHSAAQYLLGQRYFYGHGLPMDKNKAMSYLQAASTEDYRAAAFLKIIAKGSRGEIKDHESIVATVIRMAKAKVSDAQYTLGFMHLIGDGVPRDAAEEVRWYRAASTSNARAAFMLSLMYQSGEGVPHSPAEAFRFMRIAAEQGNARAQYFLGSFYYHGEGTVVDRQAAGAWFRKSAENGFSEAQLAFGMLLLSGDGVEVDKAQAIEWLGKSSSQGNSRAKEVLGELLTYRGQKVATPMTDTAMSAYNTEKRKAEDQLRVEGKGVLLDQGSFGLKFSLPTLYDAYEPKDQATPRPLKQNFQGGMFDIIIRSF
jgi:TPR repeat protein